MSQIKVITTESVVYTTFYKTIHFKQSFSNHTEMQSAYTDACSVAFNLACTDTHPICEREVMPSIKSDNDVFAYLEKTHKKHTPVS